MNSNDYRHELWMPFHGYEEFYLISSKGRFISLRTGRLMNIHCEEHKGYYKVLLRKKGFKRKAWRVNRAVYYHFGPNPLDDTFEVHHKDHDKSNNDISNLLRLSGPENRKAYQIWRTDKTLDKSFYWSYIQELMERELSCPGVGSLYSKMTKECGIPIPSEPSRKKNS